MKRNHCLYLLVLLLMLSACDSNPAWDGHKPKEKAERLAAGTCKCLYEMAGKEPGWELSKIMDEVEAIHKKVKGNIQMAVLGSSNPAIVKALEGEEDFSLKMDDCECMKPIQDGLLEQGVSFEAMMEQLDQHCLLGAFYN